MVSTTVSNKLTFPFLQIIQTVEITSDQCPVFYAGLLACPHCSANIDLTLEKNVILSFICFKRFSKSDNFERFSSPPLAL